MKVRRVTEIIDDLKSGCFLAFQPEGIDRVYECDGMRRADVSYQAERLVEVSFNCDHLRAVYERLRQFAKRDLPFGNEDAAPHAGSRRIGGRSSGCVSCRSA